MAFHQPSEWFRRSTRSGTLSILFASLITALLLPLSACAGTPPPTGRCTPPCCWSGEAAPPVTNFSLPAPYFSAAGGVVYVNFPNQQHGYDIAAMRASDGALIWQEPNSLGAGWLTIEHDLLLVSGPDWLVALRAADGALLWRISRGVAAYGGSPLVERNGILYAMDNTGLYAVRVADGTLLWQLRRPADITPSMDGDTVSGPVVGGDTVYFGAVNGELFAVRASDGKIRWIVTASPSSSLPIGPAFPQVTPIGMVAGYLYIEGYGGLRRVRVSDGALEGRAPDLPATGDSFRTVALGTDGYVVITENSPSDSLFTYTVLDSEGRPRGHANTNGGPSSVVTFERNTLYLLGNGITAFHIPGGATLWNRQFKEVQDFAATPGYVFLGLSGMRDLCHVGNNYLPKLVALNSADGSIAWESSLEPTR